MIVQREYRASILSRMPAPWEMPLQLPGLWPSPAPFAYTPAVNAADDPRNLALALDAFMSEHRRCWRLYGEGLDSGEDGEVLWVECLACTALMVLSR